MANDTRDIVLSIYDTITDQSLWPTVLDRIVNAANAKGCIIFEWDECNHGRSLLIRHHSSYYDRLLINDYIEKMSDFEFQDQDIFERYSLQSDAIDLLDDAVIAPHPDDLRQRKNVQMLLQYGLFHRAGCLLNKDNVTMSRFSIQFGAGRGRPTNDEITTINLYLPHIAKALDLGRPAAQLARERCSLLAAMDLLTIGVCALSKSGEIIYKNEEFSRQLQDCRAFYEDSRGRLRLYRASDQKNFARLIKDVMVHGSFGARPRKEAISTDDEHFLSIELSPLFRNEELGTAEFDGILLYSADTSKPVRCNTYPVKQVFGLTDAEMMLVDAIADGLTNNQIAEMRGRAVGTINAQVKSILSKTNCATRTQFVRLLMNFGMDFIARDKPRQDQLARIKSPM